MRRKYLANLYLLFSHLKIKHVSEGWGHVLVLYSVVLLMIFSSGPSVWVTCRLSHILTGALMLFSVACDSDAVILMVFAVLR